MIDSDDFARRGFAVARGMVPAAAVDAMRDRALADLDAEAGPLEREADVGYPGAPTSVEAPGGRTVRRLLEAYDRGPSFRAWVHDPTLVDTLARCLDERPRFCPNHHNCVMTKMPRFSSDTGWHRDLRYWRFERPELVTAWLALTPESSPQGSLCLLPGSHRLDLADERFDEAEFLDLSHPDNEPLAATAEQVELTPGDVLFFHARLFHHATRNHTDRPKLAAVFTFLGESNAPVPGTKSARRPSVPLP